MTARSFRGCDQLLVDALQSTSAAPLTLRSESSQLRSRDRRVIRRHQSFAAEHCELVLHVVGVRCLALYTEADSSKIAHANEARADILLQITQRTRMCLQNQSTLELILSQCSSTSQLVPGRLCRCFRCDHGAPRGLMKQPWRQSQTVTVTDPVRCHRLFN